MAVYIKGIGNISPQHTADANAFSQHDILPVTNNRLACIEPEYTQFVDAKQLRRMSRVIRMGVASSMTALKDAGIEKPDAVIVGTALGCLEDTASFLTKLVQNKEEMLSPTAFIFSTHNTIAAQIAYLLQCRGYNSTYVHRNISFESALIDATLLINEGSENTVLVGGIDELTDASFKIFNRLGHFKKEEELVGKSLFESVSKGSIAGEGAAFFTLVNSPSADCYAEIVAVETLSFATKEDVIMKATQLGKSDIIIAGYNGDANDDAITSAVVSGLGMEAQTLKFKHLSGEFGTASGFATWLAAVILKNKNIPANLNAQLNNCEDINSILIYNQYQNQHHSLILLKAC